MKCTSLATLLYWYVAAEIEEGESGGHFDLVRQQLLSALAPEAQALLQQQVLLRKKLLFALRHAKNTSVAVAMASLAKRDWAEKKVERFKSALLSEQEETGLNLVHGRQAQCGE